MPLKSVKSGERRRFLKGAGAAIATLPWLNLSRLHAAPDSVKRLLIVFNPNGGHDERWRPSGSANAPVLSHQLEPLSRHLGRLRLMTGIDISSAHDEGFENLGDRHHRANGHLLTGVPMIKRDGDEDPWAGGQSIDQFVAGRLGQDTAFGSLHLGVAMRDNGTSRHRICYRGAGDAIPPLLDPWIAAEQVFSGATNNAASERNTARTNFVLDRASLDLKTLQSQLGVEARCQLEQHTTSLEAVAKSLQLLTAAQCGAPPLPGEMKLNAQFTPQIAAAQQQILVSGLQCDLIKVGVLMYGQGGGGSGDLNLQFDPLNIAANHHELGHQFDDNAKRQMDLVHRWEADQLAQLVDNLEQTLDSSGQPLIDSTLIWWASDLGNAYKHMAQNVRQMLIGGGIPAGYSQFNSEPHHKLLVTVLRQLGISDVDHYGSAAFGKGPLPGLG